MINYTTNPNSHVVTVRLDRKRVGRIMPVKGGPGWFYKPDGHEPGETLPSIAAVKRSLESDK